MGDNIHVLVLVVLRISSEISRFARLQKNTKLPNGPSEAYTHFARTCKVRTTVLRIDNSPSHRQHTVLTATLNK